VVYVYDEPRLMSTIQRFIPEQEDFQLLFLSTQVFDMHELNIQYPSHYSHPQQNSVMISSHPPSIGKHNFQQATTHMRISSTFYTQQKKLPEEKDIVMGPADKEV
jgi:predicted DNA-binding helix-hairpin-helix protein